MGDAFEADVVVTMVESGADSEEQVVDGLDPIWRGAKLAVVVMVLVVLVAAYL